MKNNNPGSRGRPCLLTFEQQLSITIFKLRYNLPYRVLEALTGIDHVTLSRMVRRRVDEICQQPLVQTEAQAVQSIKLDKTLVVDTTTIRLGKSSTQADYTGHKHIKGLKFQCIVSQDRQIQHVSPAYPASVHDKKVFEKEQALLPMHVTSCPIIGDNAYVGLHAHGVTSLLKKCDNDYKVNPEKSKTINRNLSKSVW